ncbi:MAG: GYD domain-containing protein [Chloroflexi bacterium]|nr:GYD domain-containing protein [Chloroflexota bacterium]
MPIYIQLLTLTQEGKERMVKNPASLLLALADIHVPGVQPLGQYAVLGEYDYVSIVDARDNEAIALFSLHLGVRVGAHIATLPTVPLGRLEELEDDARPSLLVGAEAMPPTQSPDDEP